MSFYLHESNDLATLAGLLAQTLRTHKGARAPDPFDSEIVVVPNQGIGRWLSLRLAESEGLCPPLEMPYPGAFLYRYLFDQESAASGNGAIGAPEAAEDAPLPFAPATTAWRLHRLLVLLEPRAAFERVRKFIQGDPLRRHQLAARLARLFDRYMTYRPDLLRAWESGGNPLEGEDAAWQAQLWCALAEDNRADGGSAHFSGLYNQFVALRPQELEQRLAVLRARGRASYFGVSSLPPAHLDLLVRAAQTTGIELHFFALNPCREMWYDTQSLKNQLRVSTTLVEAVGAGLAAGYETLSNHLLGSLGRSGRDFFALLLAYDQIQCQSHFLEPAEDQSMLATLQRDILDNQPPPPAKLPVADSDTSITLHACHSPMREIEALHDHLLGLFARLKDLEPRDICVYLPDVEAYAPYIEAVFGRHAPGAPGHLPYTLADKSLLASVAQCRAFMELLAVADGRFKATEVLSLLQNEQIRLRFELSESDLAQLGALLKAANLAWGLDAGFREQEGGASIYANTWRFALDRLLLGTAMRGSPGNLAPLALDGGASPCLPLHEAAGAAALVGRLCEALEALTALHEFCAADRRHTCAAWHQWLHRALESFFAESAAEPYALALLRRSFDLFQRLTAHAGCAELELPFAVVRDWLAEELKGTPARERFVSGRITFARFQPMRNAPARVVCMVGMNDGAFPRQSAGLSFDLMERANARRLGDRTTRDEDRYAFLETLMAAREHLAITYTGQSEKDNQALPPSVLVGELLDAVDATFNFSPSATGPRRAADALTLRHPLHPFSPAYFQGNAGLHSFSRTNFEIASHLSDPQSRRVAAAGAQPDLTQQPATDQTLTIDFNDLLAFCRDPCKHYYTRVLGVYLEIRDAELPDDEEMLEPDGLDKYLLKADLMELFDQNPGLAAKDIRRAWEISGRLPVKSDAFFTSVLNAVEKVREERTALVGAAQPLEPREFSLEWGESLRLQGSLKNLYPGGQQLMLRLVKSNANARMAAWLGHLAACASGEKVETWLLSESGKPEAFTPIAPDQALERLRALTEFYRQRHRGPVLFTPELGSKARDNKVITAEDWSGGQFTSGVGDYLKQAFGEELPPSDLPQWQSDLPLLARLALPQS